MKLEITLATPADAADMAALHARAWEAAYAGIIPDAAILEMNAKRPAMWEHALSGENTHYYIARLSGAAVGLLGIHPTYDDDRPGAGEVGAIYLHPDFWGKGHGRTLMDFGLRRLAEQGFSLVTLWVLEDNARARRFYEACGFAFDGTKKEIVIGKSLIEVRYAFSVKEESP